MPSEPLMPIRVKIGLKDSGGHKYPPFDAIPAEIRRYQTWTRFIDQYGSGWFYDHLHGHGEGDYAHGEWSGCILVPEAFALAAEAMFPEDVTVLNEAAFAQFYDEKHSVRIPSMKYDSDRLAGIESKIRLSFAIAEIDPEHPILPEKAKVKARKKEKLTVLDVLDDDELEALDPSNPRSAMRHMAEKTWAGMKARKNFTIKEKV